MTKQTSLEELAALRPAEYARVAGLPGNRRRRCVCGHPFGMHTVDGCSSHVKASPERWAHRCDCQLSVLDPDAPLPGVSHVSLIDGVQVEVQVEDEEGV